MSSKVYESSSSQESPLAMSMVLPSSKKKISSGHSWLKKATRGPTKLMKCANRALQTARDIKDIATKGGRIVRRDWSKLGAGAVTFGAGLGHCFSPSGIAMMVTGGHCIYSVLRQHMSEEEAKLLLEDAKAMVNYAQQLGEANDHHLEHLDQRLETAKKHLSDAQAHVLESAEFAKKGGAESAKIYEEATKQWQLAQADFDKARNRFEQARKLMGRSRERLIKAEALAKGLIELGAQTSDNPVEQAQRFVAQVEALSKHIKYAQNGVNSADICLGQGCGFLEMGHAKNTEAHKLFAQAHTTAQLTLQHLAETKELNEKLQSAQDELEQGWEHIEELKENNKLQRRCLDQASKDIETVQHQLDSAFGWSELLWAAPAAGGAALFGFGTFGVGTAAVAGPVVAKYVAPKALDAMHYYASDGKEMPVASLNQEASLEFQFDNRSTGVRRALGYSSKTQGTLSLKLHNVNTGKDEAFALKVNLNGFSGDSSRMVRFNPQIKLAKKLRKGVERGDYDPAQVLKLVAQMQTAQIDRGTTFFGSKRSFQGSLISRELFAKTIKACKQKLG